MAERITHGDCPAKAKTFIPLENNPTVMTSLLQSLGLPHHLGFTDIYSLTEPDLLSLVPRPSLALLLVFPLTDAYESNREAEDALATPYSGSGAQEPVTWFRQTIRNACGLMGILHAAANGETRTHLLPGSELDELFKQAESLAPEERAQLLYDSPALESAHGSHASQGDSVAPDRGEKIDLHFLCFTKGKDGRLWELDGRRKGPRDCGVVLEEGEDMLSDTALNAGVKKVLDAEVTDMRFSLISLGPLFE